MRFLRWRHVVPMTVLAWAIGVLNGTLIDLPREQQGDEANRERSGSQAVVVPSSPQDSLGAPPQSEDTDRYTHEDLVETLDPWLEPEPITNLALIVVAIWAGCIAIKTLRSVNKQSHASVRSGRAAEASAAIALAHKRLGDRHLDTSKAIERAYLYANHIIAFEGFTAGSAPSVLIEIRNSGHTPGWIVRTGVALIDVADVAKHLPRPLPAKEIGMRLNKQVVFSGQHTTMGNRFSPVIPAVEAAIRAGSKLVVFGRIEYRDTFNDTHYTDFSFVWDRFKAGRSGGDDFHIHPDGYTDAT